MAMASLPSTPVLPTPTHPLRDSTARLDPRRVPQAELVAVAVSVVLATLWLRSDPTGTDLAAQLARARFAAAHPATPVDLSWFGGMTAFSYSVLSPYVMAVLGVRVTGWVCCVLASWLLARLFVRTGARRPALAAATGAVLQTLNLVAGRVTFGLGTVFALACLVALASPGRRSTARAGTFAALCALSSPVAAFFLLLAATTLAVVRRPREALVVGLAVVAPVALVEHLFGQGGRQPFHEHDLLVALAPMLVVAVVCWGRRELRWGALLAAVAIVAVAVAATPLGDNAARLSLLFAPPVVIAYTTWRGRWLVVAITFASLPQQLDEVNAFGLGSQSSSAFYAPLRAEISDRGPVTGRLEVPETWGHWDASALESTAPLARGWNRQLDRRWDALFFEDRLDPASYRHWLRTSRVQYVAVPDVAYTAAGRREADLVATGLPFLQEVWADPGWRLYEVVDARPIVPRPARLVTMDAAAVTFTAPAGEVVRVGIRMTPWTTLRATDATACVTTGADRDVIVRTGSGGRYRLTSTLGGRSARC